MAFGDVLLENKAPVPTALNVEVGRAYANIRLLPNTQARTLVSLKPGQPVEAVERLADNSWVRINLPGSGETGWIKTELLHLTSDIKTLNVANATQPSYRPMQAFTFKSGADQQNCAEVPRNGLVIQTPEGAGEVHLWINQVVVKLGSTVYFQAQANGDMTVTTLEGHATVQALGTTYTAVAGTRLHIKMDADMNPISAPSLPEAYQMTDVQNLPIDHLQRAIAIHSPLTQQEVTLLQQTQQDPCAVTACNGTTDDGNSITCPGNSCHNGTNNNNGNGGNGGDNANCPGNSCHNGTNNNNGNGDKDKNKGG